MDPKTNGTNFFSPAYLLENESVFKNANIPFTNPFYLNIYLNANIPFANLIDANVYLEDENHNPITDPSVTLAQHDGFAGIGLSIF